MQDLTSTLMMVALMGAAFYFLLIRPQKKRAKEQQDKLSRLEPGTRVMTVSGIVGTVKHVGDKQVIVELAPGVEMTVVKQAISTQAVEDEFEYADDVDGDDLPEEVPLEIEVPDDASGLVDETSEEADPTGTDPKN